MRVKCCSPAELAARRTRRLRYLKDTLLGLSLMSFVFVAAILVPSAPSEAYLNKVYVAWMILIVLKVIVVAAYLMIRRSLDAHRMSASADDT